MRVSGLVETSVERHPAAPPQTDAMREVDRAWRHQFADLREARDAAARAVRLAEAANDRPTLGDALFQAAYAATRHGAGTDAGAAAIRCRSVFEQLDDRRGVWRADVLAAVCDRLDGQRERSLRRLRALVADVPPDASPIDLFIVHVALSVGYRFAGALEPALKWHFQAVETARDTGDPLLLATALCNLGGYHCDLHNHDEGSRLLEEALALTSAASAYRTALIVALNLSQAYAVLGRHDEALRLAETYLTDEHHVLAVGGNEPLIALTLALAYANAGRPDDARRTFDGVPGAPVAPPHEPGAAHVFRAYVDTRIALVAGRPHDAARIALAVLDGVDGRAVDSPFDLMQLHAAAANALEQIDDYRGALRHERERAAIRERLARLAARVATLTQTVRHELDAARAERDRALALHAELERDHERLASLNGALTSQIAENQRLHDELKEQNFRDALTGLHNRRYLYERGPRQLEHALATGTPLCLVMLDLDHFKRVNDAYGHAGGDRVLVALGRRLREALRDQDIVCRVGGEEFAMVLPNTTTDVARGRLEEVLRSVGALASAPGEPPLPTGLTFSAGVVEAPALGTTIDALMIAADRLLYKAKHDGRARIETRPSSLAWPVVPAAREAVDHVARGDETEDRRHRHD